MSEPEKTPLLTRIVGLFLRGDLAILLTVVSLIIGLVALWLTPREEEPQIVVPMADVLVSAPGISAEEVERQITTRLERALYQIDGVEYIYSMSSPGQAVVTVRFYVGQDREDSLVKLYNKIQSNLDVVPPAVTAWVVKPVEVDDVPIVNVSLWSENPKVGGHELRRIAEQLEDDLKSVPNTNRVTVIGGYPRQIRVQVNPLKLAARGASMLEVAQALRAGNVNVRAGAYDQQDKEFVVDAGTFVADAVDLENLVVHVAGNRPVYLKDVADVIDGPAEADNYTWMGFGPAARNPLDPHDRAPADEDLPLARAEVSSQLYPAVHIAVAKQKGTNAVRVAEAVEERMSELAPALLPDGVYFRITRDYGETANDKVNELVISLVIAVLTVIGLVWAGIGWRAAVVIALAVPVCYGVTLFINLLVGYTINRVTLFALILSLGLLVDDPITDVENIARYFAMRTLPPRPAVLRAVQEVRPALILSTLAIVASFVPLLFITGMMGPYMAPMALNVPMTVIVSTFVSFMITPWMAMALLKKGGGGHEQAYELTKRPIYRASRGVFGLILHRRWLAWAVLGAVALLFAGSLAIPAFRVVPLKMLPFDNKNEFQVVVDMPEGTTLERTDEVARQLGAYLAGANEVRDYQVYSGLSSPMDFNGMVRHYFLRRGSNVADIRVNLAPKRRRAEQSHAMLLRLRSELTRRAAAAGANIKLVEVPPGPPVISTITAEVYGPPQGDYASQIRAARRVRARMEREPGVVDVDISAEADQRKRVFVTDEQKAALSGVSKENIAQTLQLGLQGMPVTVLHVPTEVDPLSVVMRLKRSERSAEDDLEEVYVEGQRGQMVQIGALGAFADTHPDGTPILEDKTIYRKNFRRVVYVFGEVAGRPPADAIMDMEFDRRPEGQLPAGAAAAAPRPVSQRTWLSPGGGDPWTVPEGYQVVWAGEGEWKITLDVFRDLGLAFAAALVGIFVLLMFETRSQILPLVIMLAIPLTLIGIMPGFWLLNMFMDRTVGGYPNPVFFTATAMIGMIGLAGIVIRNAVVLIDFIHHGQAAGLSLQEAIVQSVAVRTRPILLTSGTTLLGNWVITLDPIFSGLAWATIFGLFASTLFTLLVIPVVYWLLYARSAAATPAK